MWRILERTIDEVEEKCYFLLIKKQSTSTGEKSEKRDITTELHHI
jgi:hypothetical protein